MLGHQPFSATLLSDLDVDPLLLFRIVRCRAIEAREDFPIGLEDVRPIIDDPAALCRRMKRVDVQTIGIKTDDDVMDEIIKWVRPA